MEPVLNERSVEPSAVSVTERFTSLLGILWQLDKLGFPKVLRHVRQVRDLEIEPGVSFHVWLFQRAPKEMRQALAGRMQKAPFVEDLHESQEAAQGAQLQAYYDGAPAVGAGVAYLRDAPAVALYGIPRWEQDPLRIILARMDDDEEGLTEAEVEIIHLSRVEQIAARERSLRERILRAVDGGADLWQRRLMFFPRLDFCAAVERQLCALSGKEFYFHHIVAAFARLDAALEAWTTGPLHPGMDSSSESDQTLSHRDYGPMRKFLCPDGQTRRFSNHLKLFANNWRIYYWEVRNEAKGGRAFIGYAGAHLPTVRYRT